MYVSPLLTRGLAQLDLIMEIRENIPLAGFTTLGVGGPARYFVDARAEADVIDAFAWARENELDVFVLGGGSNIVVSDAGIGGLVVKIGMTGVTFEDEGARVLVSAAAGEDWEGLVAACVGRGLGGFECLSGIPGTVGGTPVQNVGAYGQEVSETIVSVRCFDRSFAEVVELSNAECGFEYRKSIFNTTERGRFVVMSVSYLLEKEKAPKIDYKDLKEKFVDRNPTLAEVRESVLRIRRSKSMVIDEADPNSRSAGSFFKNPVLDVSAAEPLDSPRFPAGEGLVKIPAAWLIEQAGFQKGFALGNAGISGNHSLAIVNRGGSTAAEIVALRDLIRKGVFEKFGIELETEPVFVGF